VEVRNYVGTLRDHSNTRIFSEDDTAGDRLVEVGDRFDPGQRTLFVRQAGRIERDSTDAHRFELHFGLPFVDVRQRLGGQRREELVGAEFDQTALGGAEFFRAEPFRAGRSNNEGASGLQNIRVTGPATFGRLHLAPAIASSHPTA